MSGQVRGVRVRRCEDAFWDRFTLYTRLAGFEPFVTSLVPNHYHILGYPPRGEELGQMMRKLVTEVTSPEVRSGTW